MLKRQGLFHCDRISVTSNKLISILCATHWREKRERKHCPTSGRIWWSLAWASIQLKIDINWCEFQRGVYRSLLLSSIIFVVSAEFDEKLCEACLMFMIFTITIAFDLNQVTWCILFSILLLESRFEDWFLKHLTIRSTFNLLRP